MREELTLCDRWGIPHSEFLSWDEMDQDKAVAFARQKAAMCQTCATWPDEWEADRFAYVVDADRCPGCELIETERDQLEERFKNNKGALRGLRVFLRRRSKDETVE